METLATQFEQVNQSVIDMVAGSAHMSVTCPAEGWTAVAVGAHVGGGHSGIVESLIKPIVAGQQLQPFDVDSFTEGGAKAAAENAAMPRNEVLQLLRDHGASAAYLRSLSGEHLDRTTSMPVFGDKPVTAEQVIEMVRIGHSLDQGNSLRQGLGRQFHSHELQSVPV